MNVVVRKIISGGQTGADRGGLEAGKKLGIETGGWVPRGYRTENGPDLSLKEFGVAEHSSGYYALRTALNVRDSDGTVMFVVHENSPGVKCTIKAAKEYKKPLLVMNIREIPTMKELRKWIVDNGINVLNVAGHRESTCEGMQRLVQLYLTVALIEPGDPKNNVQDRSE